MNVLVVLEIHLLQANLVDLYLPGKGVKKRKKQEMNKVLYINNDELINCLNYYLILIIFYPFSW